jgi:hypothetical protein
MLCADWESLMSNSINGRDSGTAFFSNRDVAKTLRSSCRDLDEVVRILDAKRQSDTAGRLHTLTIELRQLAAMAELRADESPLSGGEEASEKFYAVAVAH